ncbi:flagellin [Polycladidibacter stylochi]|uniref:flagellin N-terminal helical domain-containing protein n=1 Tax=Polycladidibacter stylochi TaxID=1807766 RepID=UPI00082F1AAE|nr:flagellin [Pseudovibrio stylochi]
MSSLLTNSSAMIALNTLSAVNKKMGETQSRISTGLRVSDASDNAAYWSISTTMKSDNTALSAVKDSLGLGAATIDVAFTAMDQSIKVVDEIKNKLVAATDNGLDKEKIQSDISQLQKQLSTITASANFSGENWLQQNVDKDELKKSISGSVRRNKGVFSLEEIHIDTKHIVLVNTSPKPPELEWLHFGMRDGEMHTHGAGLFFEVPVKKAILTDTFRWMGSSDDKKDFSEMSTLTMDISGLSTSKNDLKILNKLIEEIDIVQKKMSSAASTLGSVKKRVTLQSEFVIELSDAISRGVGQLVDADMNVEATHLKALQTQQQLGIQALSIANNSAQNILSLFR